MISARLKMVLRFHTSRIWVGEPSVEQDEELQASSVVLGSQHPEAVKKTSPAAITLNQLCDTLVINKRQCNKVEKGEGIGKRKRAVRRNGLSRFVLKEKDQRYLVRGPMRENSM